HAAVAVGQALGETGALELGDGLARRRAADLEGGGDRFLAEARRRRDLAFEDGALDRVGDLARPALADQAFAHLRTDRRRGGWGSRHGASQIGTPILASTSSQLARRTIFLAIFQLSPARRR